jgi:mannose-6-phosphate isomerase
MVSALKLHPHQIEKPWGRTEIPVVFGGTDGKRIGEIWFEPPFAEALPLLAKCIFTSENLSIQVHPSDEDARTRGLASGKAEGWYILDAEPDATLGLGLIRLVKPDELRSAALDGSIEELIDWKPVSAGDFYFVPPGTIHAIGAGISLLEFQQNADITYRLYDYGRPRELHLDDAINVARPCPYSDASARTAGTRDDVVLLNGPRFSLVRASKADSIPGPMNERRRWVMPIHGRVSAGTVDAAAGECLLVEPSISLEFLPDSTALIGCEGTL